MKITFQMGYNTGGVVPEVSVEFNTPSNYDDYIFALTMIQGIIAAKINEYSLLADEYQFAC